MASQPPVAPAFQDGATTTIGGVPYVRQGGRWRKQGGAAGTAPAPIAIAPPNPMRVQREQLEQRNIESTIADRAIENERAARTEDRLGRVEERQVSAEERQISALERVPEKAADTLREIAGMARSLGRAREGFLPEFAGNKITGDLENRVQATFSGFGTPGQRDWWADFRRTDIGERNQLFGAALTPHEAAAFASTTIDPSADPDIVNQNVSRRYEAALGAARRQRDFLFANGYNREAVNAILGQDLIALLDQPQQQPVAQGASTGVPGPSSPAATPTDPPVLRDGPDRSTMVAAPGAGPRAELSQGETRLERDPALAGVNARLGKLLASGTSEERIRQYVDRLGLAAETQQSLEQALAFRRSPAFRTWRQQNPDKAYPVNVEMREVPVSGARQFLAETVDTAPGAYFASTANMLAGQRIDQVAEALGAGNGEVIRAGLEEVRDRNPISSLAGDTTGALMLYGAGAAGLARAGVGGGGAGAFAGRQLGIDAGIGAYQGQGLDRENPLGGAAIGGLVALGTGAASRGAINTIGRAVAPSGGSARPLYDAGVESQTVGQRFAQSGPMGRAWNKIEEVSADIPIIGTSTVGAAREGARREFQRGAYNDALSEIGQELPAGVQTGPRANAFMQRAFNDEFRAIRGAMSFRPDGGFAADLGRIQQTVRELSDDEISQFERIVRSQVGGRLQRAGNQLSGDQYIRSVSKLNARAAEAEKKGNTGLATALRELSDAMDDAAIRRSGPDLGERLGRARAGYARSVIIEDAARRRGGEVGEFSPTQFDAAVQGSSGLRSRSYLRGEALMQDYATAGRALGDTVPNSGTNMRQIATGGGGAGLAGLAATGLIPVEAAAFLATPAGLAVLTNFPLVRQAIQSGLNPNRGAVSPALRAELERLGPVVAGAIGAASAQGVTNALAQ